MSAEQGRLHAERGAVEAIAPLALGSIDAAALLSDVHVLVVGTFPAPGRRRIRAWLQLGAARMSREALWGPFGAGTADLARGVLLLRATKPGLPVKGTLHVSVGELEIAFEPDFDESMVPLQTLAAMH